MGTPKPTKPVGDKLTEKAASKAEKLHAKAEKLHTTVDRISAKAKVQAESLERLAARLESVELWMRDEPGQRQARFTRSELAQTAIRIVDAEGLDALSMRRLAAELGAGTMTLYHYVRTKDELLTLVSDEVMAEVLLPEGYELPSDWREAIVVVALRSRDAMRRHPWVFDLSGDLGLGPNSVKHMDQTLQAVDGIEAPLATKLDVVVAIDGYVFGYCLQERSVDERRPAARRLRVRRTSSSAPASSRSCSATSTSSAWTPCGRRSRTTAPMADASSATSAGSSEASRWISPAKAGRGRFDVGRVTIKPRAVR